MILFSNGFRLSIALFVLVSAKTIVDHLKKEKLDASLKAYLTLFEVILKLNSRKGAKSATLGMEKEYKLLSVYTLRDWKQSVAVFTQQLDLIKENC